QGYLRAWDRIASLLAQHHVWMLFDFHQDMMDEDFQGEGLPKWAVDAVKGQFAQTLPAPSFGFPFNYFTPQVSQTFDNLWAEHGPVCDSYRAAWIAAADHWKNQSYSMGYDLFNEPWAGLEAATCLVPEVGCPSTDSSELQPFFEYAIAGIRTVDQNNI